MGWCLSVCFVRRLCGVLGGLVLDFVVDWWLGGVGVCAVMGCCSFGLVGCHITVCGAF